MEEYRSPTNDLIDRLVSKLTREDRETLEEIESIGDALVRGRISQEEAKAAEKAMHRRMDHPRHEGDILSKVLELKAQGHEVIEQEHAKASADARRFEEMIHRAQKLEQAEGKDSRPDMMLREAVEVLRRHGELT